MLYSLIIPGHVARKGRQVDARVLSCKEVRPGVAGSREGNSCYEVTVDFYGIKGEEIKKTFFSQAPYGYQDEELYAKIYSMFREAVPENVWKELKEREKSIL